MCILLLSLFFHLNSGVRSKRRPIKLIKPVKFEINLKRRFCNNMKSYDYSQNIPLDLRILPKVSDTNGTYKSLTNVISKKEQVNSLESILRYAGANIMNYKTESTRQKNSEADSINTDYEMSSSDNNYRMIIISIQNYPLTVTNNVSIYIFEFYKIVNETKVEFYKIVNICTKANIQKRFIKNNDINFMAGMCNFIKTYIDFDYISLVKEDIISLKFNKETEFKDKILKLLLILKKFLQENKKRAFKYFGNIKNFPRYSVNKKQSFLIKEKIEPIIKEFFSKLETKNNIYNEIVNELKMYGSLIFGLCRKETLIFLYILHSKYIFDINPYMLYYDEKMQSLDVKPKEKIIKDEFNIHTLKMLFYSLIFKKHKETLEKQTINFLKQFVSKVNDINPTLLSEIEYKKLVVYLEDKSTNNTFLNFELSYVNEFNDFIRKYNLIINEFF